MKLGLATIGVVVAMLLAAPKGAGAAVIDPDAHNDNLAKSGSVYVVDLRR